MLTVDNNNSIGNNVVNTLRINPVGLLFLAKLFCLSKRSFLYSIFINGILMAAKLIFSLSVSLSEKRKEDKRKK
jgi:ethanolamine transporter EutH